MEYEEWNVAIAQHFFNTGKGGKEVLIFVNEEKINEIGSAQKVNVTDFLAALKKEAGKNRGDICKTALDLYKGWRKQLSQFPPYIAFLALFVLASTTEGDFDPKAYYPRFWKLVDQHYEGTPAGFYETSKLWDDLEKWSVEDKKEELGRFKSRIRGNWRHVGRPLSQTLLSDDERKALGSIFYDCGFDPENIPSEDMIKSGLIHHGQKRLRHRTLTLLKSEDGDNQELINALLDLVITELEEWGKGENTPSVVDQPVINAQTEKEKEPPVPSLFLRTCIEFDEPKKQATISLRLKTIRPYPENGLHFKVDSITLACSETVPLGWSTKLMEVPGNTSFDPSKLDWNEDWRFVDADNRWTAIYKKSNLRVFLPGDEENIPGYIESQKLTRDCEFRIICHNAIGSAIKRWGEKSCKNFSQLNYSGIPSGWLLFKGSEPTEPCEGIDVLGFSNLVRIQLDGGIGLGRSNLYLCFAPPRIRIDGRIGNEKLLLNGTELEKPVASTFWMVSEKTPIGRPLNIEIWRTGELLESRVIQLVEPSISIESMDSITKRDRQGNIATESDVTDYVRGGLVVSTSQTGMELPRISPSSLSGSLIFVGQVAGQISRGSLDKNPALWSPVWILSKVSKREWVTHFCRQRVSEDLAPIATKAYSIKDRRLWRKSLWIMRKRIRSPELPALRTLWTKYLEAAKDV